MSSDVSIEETRETTERISLQTSLACSLVAVFPVPIAQMGLYAIIGLEICLSDKSHNAFFTCCLICASVSPFSYCSSDSPTHRIGRKPCLKAAWSFLFTVSSVSLKYIRLSE